MKSAPTRVLIIDDDPLIRTLLVSALKKECLVAVAADGSEGYHRALELVPDVAVIDVNMPGWDGLKTLDEFRAHEKLKDVKVIMLTADSSKQTVMAAIRGGASDYLIKTNFSKAEFYRKLNRLVAGTITDRLAGVGTEFDPVTGEPIAPADDVDRAAESNGNEFDDPVVPGGRAHDQQDSAQRQSQLQELIDSWE